MFDKKPSVSTPNNQNNPSPKITPPGSAAPLKEDVKKPTEDIFSSVDSEQKGDIDIQDKQENISKILSPESPPNSISPGGGITTPPNLPINKPGLNAKKSAPQKKGVLAVLMIIIFLLIALGAGAWYYFNYLDVENVLEEKIIDEKQDLPTEPKNNNINANINSNMPVVNKNINQNANKNITPIVPEVDSDSDGLTDSEEKKIGTSIYSADTDKDGLLDKEEIKIYKTDPLKVDTDGDGFNDGEEIKGGYNPLGKGKLSLPL